MMGTSRLRSGRGLSTSVIEAVASAEGVDPVELSEPLFAAVEPDALDRLFRAGTGCVTFQYLGYEVTAHGDGEVTVEPRATG